MPKLIWESKLQKIFKSAKNFHFVYELFQNRIIKNLKFIL